MIINPCLSLLFFSILNGNGVPHTLDQLEVSVYSSKCNDNDATDGSGKVKLLLLLLLLFFIIIIIMHMIN